jgi:hypothetical protein
MSVMVNQAPPATTRRSRTRLVVQAVVSLVLVVAIFYYLRKKFDPAQAWAAITAMTGLELVTLGLLPILVGVGCYVWWRRRSWTTSPEDARRGRAEATVTASPDRPTKG